MKPLICFFILLISAYSCKQEKTVQIPATVLGKEAFAGLLTDFALAEAAANMNIKNVQVHKIDSVYAFNPLLENKIDKAQYDSTLAFYSRHADLYLEVYQLVLERLNNMQTRRDSLKTQTASKDSIAISVKKSDSLKLLPKKKKR